MHIVIHCAYTEEWRRAAGPFESRAETGYAQTSRCSACTRNYAIKCICTILFEGKQVPMVVQLSSVHVLSAGFGPRAAGFFQIIFTKIRSRKHRDTGGRRRELSGTGTKTNFAVPLVSPRMAGDLLHLYSQLAKIDPSNVRECD